MWVTISWASSHTGGCTWAQAPCRSSKALNFVPDIARTHTKAREDRKPLEAQWLTIKAFMFCHWFLVPSCSSDVASAQSLSDVMKPFSSIDLFSSKPILRPHDNIP
ncbi:hypothetical protein BDV36DRAFT_260970 [Aspergillus pseudocaelatus]|uniref:Secreted protein n=1 Tax=Aspergillus pseudocaelatus TaxID=1825620 RepID=A0ABQ6WG41_9EURO|nr:hypothetical protein BDV36DRAFT_260970 [Aspergillus pseudocaelatus]